MTLQLFIERFFAITLLVTGVSHLAQPKLWRDFFLLLKKSGAAGIIIAMFTFPMGLALILTHNLWSFDVRLIFTICGWGMTLKSLTYALLAGRAEKMILDDANAHRKYALGGAVMIPVSLLLVYYTFFRLA
jgi:hypothetical protein